MNKICNSNMLVVILVILLTVLVVYIALNSIKNKEMFNGCRQSDYHFPSALLSSGLQSRVNSLIKNNINERDNNILSNRHLNQVLETRRPELINENPLSPQELCYINLENM